MGIHRRNSIAAFCLFLLVLLTSSICFSAEKKAQAKLIVDRNSFRYYQWPFTFNGLTVGKPIENLELLAHLYPEKSGEIEDTVELFLNKYSLDPDAIPIFDSSIWQEQSDPLLLKGGDVQPYLKNFFSYLNISGFNYDSLQAVLFRDRSTLGQISITHSSQGLHPLGHGITKTAMIDVLGEPGWSAPLVKGAENWPAVYLWKNISAVILDGQVISITIASPVSGINADRVGPVPDDENQLSAGWLMPWKLAVGMAKNSEKLIKFKNIMKEEGIDWSNENVNMLCAAAMSEKDWLQQDDCSILHDLPVIAGRQCASQFKPLLDYFFPGIRIEKSAYNDSSCMGVIICPGILLSLDIYFSESGAMYRKQFEKVHGPPSHILDDVREENFSIFTAIYEQSGIIASFTNDRLISFSLLSGPGFQPLPEP